MLTGMSEFINWLNRELEEKGWGYNELARRAGLSSGGVSHVMTGRQNPGYEFCIKAARAVGEPPEKILRLAGHLPPRPTQVIEEDEAIDIIRQLPAQARASALAMLRGLGGQPRATSAAVSESNPTPYDPAASRLPEQLSAAFMALADHLQEDALRYVQALAEEQQREREEREVRHKEEEQLNEEKT